MLANLELDGDNGGLALRGLALRAELLTDLGLNNRGKHFDDLGLGESDRVAAVTDKAGDALSFLHGTPGLVVDVHANKGISGHADAGDELALAALHLEDLFHRHLDLEDVLLHVHRLGADLEVLLDALLE